MRGYHDNMSSRPGTTATSRVRYNRQALQLVRRRCAGDEMVPNSAGSTVLPLEEGEGTVDSVMRSLGPATAVPSSFLRASGIMAATPATCRSSSIHYGRPSISTGSSIEQGGGAAPMQLRMDGKIPTSASARLA